MVTESTTHQHSTIEQARASGTLDRPIAHACLIVYERESARLIELGFGMSVVLGREWPADAIVTNPSLSRQHARFEWKGDDLVVEDLGSRNGTLVAGKRVLSARLRSGDILELGGVTVSVHVLPMAGSASHGIDTYDSLLSALDDELSRARHFGRTFALLAVRAAGEGEGHVSRWCPRVRSELSEVDRLATYSRDSALVLLPEADAARAQAVAATLVRVHSTEPPLVVGIAVYPGSATSAAEVVAVAQNAARRATTAAPVELTETPPENGNGPANRVVMESLEMRELFAVVRRISATPVPVLLLGETGSGKEVVARVLHESGPRSASALRVVNCAAIPAPLVESVLFGHERGAFTGADKSTKGLFEEAHQGTLFLDEIGDLPLPAQAALLRVLESKSVARVGSSREIAVDVRVVAATHRDLDAMVASGQFRADLLFRLNTITVSVPPLRNRREEIESLARLFVTEANAAWGTTVRDVDAETLDVLRAYGWPGNVRELKNTMERAVAICAGATVRVSDLPERVRQAMNQPASQGSRTAESSKATVSPTDEDLVFRDRVREFEIQIIVDALTRAAGNQSRAAELLHMPLRTLVHKIRTYGIRKTYSSE